MFSNFRKRFYLVNFSALIYVTVQKYYASAYYSAGTPAKVNVKVLYHRCSKSVKYAESTMQLASICDYQQWPRDTITFHLRPELQLQTANGAKSTGTATFTTHLHCGNFPCFRYCTGHRRAKRTYSILEQLV